MSSTRPNVPFVPNTTDGMQCVVVAFRMIAMYLDKDFDIPMSEWAEICGYEQDKGTWAYGALVWFDKHSYDVRHYEATSVQDFVDDPKGALVRSFGSEVGRWCIEHTNIPAEVARAKKLLARPNILHRQEPTNEDIQRFLDDGYLLRVNVNSSRLRGKDGFIGHSIVVVGYDEAGVIAHDPGGTGYEPVPYRHIAWDLFEKCWADPNVAAKELDAIKHLPQNLL